MSSSVSISLLRSLSDVRNGASTVALDRVISSLLQCTCNLVAILGKKKKEKLQKMLILFSLRQVLILYSLGEVSGRWCRVVIYMEERLADDEKEGDLESRIEFNGLRAENTIFLLTLIGTLRPRFKNKTLLPMAVFVRC